MQARSQRLGKPARFARAIQIGDAAAAQKGMRRVDPDVGAPVPAPLAFLAAARVDGLVMQ